jgi:hypothetical protein
MLACCLWDFDINHFLIKKDMILVMSWEAKNFITFEVLQKFWNVKYGITDNTDRRKCLTNRSKFILYTLFTSTGKMMSILELSIIHKISAKRFIIETINLSQYDGTLLKCLSSSVRNSLTNIFYTSMFLLSIFCKR